MKFNFKKKYGQNFLNNENIVNKIINLTNIGEDDLVIEIGPGAGALTKKIKEFNPYLICYEIDDETKPFLEKLENDKTKIIYDDFLKRNVLEDIKDIKYSNLYIIANLPYYITTPIIMKIIDDAIPVREMTLMVQKEVAERFSALPKSKDYGSITVLLNNFFNIKKEFIVTKGNFNPAPKVDSAIIKFIRKENIVKDIDKFNNIVKTAFHMKRKNLRNNFKDYDLNLIEKVLKEYGYDLTNRAEDLELDVFIKLSEDL